MTVEALAARAQELAALAMIDAVTVTRETRGALDEFTGAYPVTLTTVWEGSGRLMPANPTVRDVAGIAVTATEQVLAIPAGTVADIRPGDRVTVGARTARVVGEVTASVTSARRFLVEVTA